MSEECSVGPSKRREKERQIPTASDRRQQSPQRTHVPMNSSDPSGLTSTLRKVHLLSSRTIEKSCNKKHEKLGDAPNSADVIDQVNVSQLTEDLTKIILQNENGCIMGKRENDSHKKTTNAKYLEKGGTKGKKASVLLDETQTLQIKKILVDCLQNIDCLDENGAEAYRRPRKTCRNIDNSGQAQNAISTKTIEAVQTPHTDESVTTASLLRSYLSGSNPAREEYISKRRNVSNSLISSDSVHHSIFLESGRERRQCLLQYLSTVVLDGQVVIYVNSIPGAEALMNFLKKHGFQVNVVHPRLLLAESNWILSEFSLKKFAVLICAEDHYHSCPAHFRWVKTIINYELPISNPLENWNIRNGVVEFSDNLPVHIYTFIKKTCPLDHELVKLLHLDSLEDQANDGMIPIR